MTKKELLSLILGTTPVGICISLMILGCMFNNILLVKYSAMVLLIYLLTLATIVAVKESK